VRTLIATDIAARGIDVEGISHVVNYDLPNIPESYVHRIGRTARAGADGIAISFCDAEERPFLRDIEKLIRMSIPATDRRGQRDGSRAPTSDAARPTHPQRRKAQSGRGRTQMNDHHHRPRDGEQPQQRRAQQAQRPHGPKHNGSQKPSRGQPQQRQSTGSDGSIASVAFLQHKQRPHKQRPHARSGGARAPQQSRHSH
jgi:ATP-dependent RNA helicase RhlE